MTITQTAYLSLAKTLHPVLAGFEITRDFTRGKQVLSFDHHPQITCKVGMKSSLYRRAAAVSKEEQS